MTRNQPTAPPTYAALRRAVENVVLRGRQQIERAWVRTYHECGRMIHEHLLRKQDRAAYGAYLFRQLAADTGVDIRTLQQSVQFYRCFPIASARSQLSWAHYRTLLHVADVAERKRLQLTAERERWTSRDLEIRVRAFNAATGKRPREANAGTPHVGSVPPLLTPQRGTPGVYRVIAHRGGLALDLGFKLYVALDEAAAEEFSAGKFAHCAARGRAVVAEGATKADLFTYAVTLRRVVDGDTLEIEIDLPRGYAHVMKLRLRGLDCPELDTAAGQAAKRFTESLVAAATAVTIYTTKPDKYDRYLADVFLTTPQTDEPRFLNNELIAAGHAVPKTDYRLEDWGF